MGRDDDPRPERPEALPMSQRPTCPICGAELPQGAPRNLCPRCLLRAGLGGDSQSLARSDGPDATAARASVLDSIAATIGHVPHVLLRDTAPGEEPGPIVRPPGGNDADTSIRYRIDGEIARGGMGAILKGHDPDLGRDVALKVLREDLRDNTDMVRRFIEEAQIGGGDDSGRACQALRCSERGPSPGRFPA